MLRDSKHAEVYYKSKVEPHICHMRKEILENSLDAGKNTTQKYSAKT